MSSSADGSVVLNVDMNVSDANKELGKLKKKIERTERDISGYQEKKREARERSSILSGELDAEKAKLQEIKDRLSDIQAMSKDKSIGINDRQGYKDLLPSIKEELADQKSRVNALQREWNKLENSADRYDQKIKASKEELVAQEIAAGELQQRINEAEAEASKLKVSDQKVVDLNKELLSLKQRQKDFEDVGVGFGYQEYDQNAARIAEITKELKEYQKALSNTESASEQAAKKMDSILGKMSDSMSKGNAAGLEGMRAAIKSISSGMRGLFRRAGKAAEAVRHLGKAAAKAFSLAAMGATKLLGKINIFPKMFNSIGLSLKKLGSLIKQALIFSVVYKGLSLVREQMGAYLSVNTQFMTALRRLQGVLLTAFQPIYEVVVPALTSLINVLSRAIATVTQFFAALFGKTASQAQTNAKDLYEQANATAAAGSAAEEASKQMADFDEINQLSGNKSASGGGGGAVETGPLFDWEYEDTPFDSWGEAFSAFLDKLLAGVPELEKALMGFADRLNNFAKKLYDMFKFPGVLDKVKQLGKDLADMMNHITDAIEWELIGRALGAGLNLALNFLTSFIYRYNWMNLGKHLAEFINGLVDEIDWYEFGRLLWAGFKIGLETLAGFLLGLNMPALAEAASKIVKGFFDEMKNTIEKIEWRQIGEKIRTFLVKLDWPGIADSVFGAIKAAFTASSDFFSGLLGEELKRTLVDMLIKISKFTLVLGAILALSGANIPLGIGLMSLGAKTLATSAVLDWEYVSSNIGTIITSLMEALGLASLAVGALLCFSGANIPLGIGLIALGAVSLATAAAINWDILPNTIDGILSKIKAILSVAFLVLGAILTFSGANIPLGLGLLAIGAIGLATTIAANWETIQPQIEGVLLALKIAAEAATLALGVVLLFSGAGIPLGLGLIGLGAAGLASTIIPNWDSILGKLKEVFGGIKSWWKGDVEQYTKAKHWEGIGRNVADGLMTGLDTVHGKLSRWASEVGDTMNRAVTSVGKAKSSISAISGSGMNYAPRIASMPALSSFDIPALAKGAVIPPNREFLAVLGDQKSGNNLEGPESSFEAAVTRGIQAAGGLGGSRNITIILQVDKREFARAVYNANNDETQRVGVRLTETRK